MTLLNNTFFTLAQILAIGYLDGAGLYAQLPLNITITKQSNEAIWHCQGV